MKSPTIQVVSKSKFCLSFWIAYTFKNNSEVLIYLRSNWTYSKTFLDLCSSWKYRQILREMYKAGDVLPAHPNLGTNCQMKDKFFKEGTSSINYD